MKTGKSWTMAMIGMLGAAGFFCGCGGHLAPVTGQASPSSKSPAPSASVGSASAPTSPSAASSLSLSTQTLTLGAMSVRIPTSWTVTSATPPRGGKAKTARARSGAAHVMLQETAATTGDVYGLLPMMPRPYGLTANPLNRQPYFSEIEQHANRTLFVSVYDLAASGMYYTADLTVPASDARVTQTFLATMALPRPATITEAVHLIENASPSALPRVRTRIDGGREQWLLASGPPATAQEPFDLFRTVDGGRHWSLIDYTTFSGPKVFLTGAGAPAMAFWSPENGVIIEPSYGGSSLQVFRTRDGGSDWNVTTISCPQTPAPFSAPTIRRSAGGVLSVKAPAMHRGKTACMAISRDGGMQWTVASKG